MQSTQSLLMAVVFVVTLAATLMGHAQAADISLEIFDAKNESHTAGLKRWRGMIDEVLKETNDTVLDAMLHNESCSPLTYTNSTPLSMCDAYNMSGYRNRSCPVPLMTSECKAIYMYTISNFSSSYSSNTRRGLWDLYRVFNALIYGAVSKLAKARPLANGTTLYRGLRGSFVVNTTGRFYFTQFTSTSYDIKVAAGYSNDTLMIIKTGNPQLMANLTGLSYMEESEVLVAPFEAFDYGNKTGNTIYLTGSATQDFYNVSKAGNSTSYTTTTKAGLSMPSGSWKFVFLSSVASVVLAILG